jgi:hypothetical protein
LRALLGGEQGDDLAEDGVGYQADATGGARIHTRSGRRTLVAGGSNLCRRRGRDVWRRLPFLRHRARSTSTLLRPHGMPFPLLRAGTRPARLRLHGSAAACGEGNRYTSTMICPHRRIASSLGEREKTDRLASSSTAG